MELFITFQVLNRKIFKVSNALTTDSTYAYIANTWKHNREKESISKIIFFLYHKKTCKYSTAVKWIIALVTRALKFVIIIKRGGRNSFYMLKEIIDVHTT